MARRHRRFGAFKHKRSSIESAIERQHKMGGQRSYTVNVKVEIERSTATIGAGGAFKAWFKARACPRTFGIPKMYTQRADTLYKRGGQCGFGYGKTPSAAYQDSLRKLAKIKR